MSRRWDVALIGDSFIDHVLSGFSDWPQLGQEAFAASYVREAGGGVVNTACGLGRLGRSVALVSVVGVEDGDWVLGRVGEFGVDTSEVLRSGRYTGMTTIASFPKDRAMFTYLASTAELDALLRDNSGIDRLSQARHIHVAYEPEQAAALLGFEKLRTAGCGISLDMGWHERWLRDPASLDLLRLTSIFLPNESEARAITGQTDPRAMLEFFARSGVGSVAIKLGEKGAVMIQEGEIYSYPGFKVDVVDTTGAGDAFDAGFIHASLDGETPERCLAIGCLCGALSTRAAGALQSLPTRADLEMHL